jgi:hypothetical protein
LLTALPCTATAEPAKSYTSQASLTGSTSTELGGIITKAKVEVSASLSNSVTLAV